MNVLKGLLRSRKVWLAIIGVAQTIVFACIPDFDPAVWQAINVLLLACIMGITLEDSASKLHKERKPDVHILPVALEGDPASMQTPPISGPAWEGPPPADPRVAPRKADQWPTKS